MSFSLNEFYFRDNTRRVNRSVVKQTVEVFALYSYGAGAIDKDGRIGNRNAGHKKQIPERNIILLNLHHRRMGWKPERSETENSHHGVKQSMVNRESNNS